jgi:thioredoxin-dependent peroxiredoxin
MTGRTAKTCFVMAILLVAPAVLLAASIPKLGSAAPAFTLNSQDGKPISLEAYRGKWVVLYFYPKDESKSCTVEAHNFERDQAQYERRNAVVLGVSLDGVDSHKRFCAKEGLEFKLLSDPDHTVSSEYGSFTNLGLVKFASRHTFVINPQGVIARVFVDVIPSKHSEEVLAVLDELRREVAPIR